jgi:hypothetical protein
MRLKLVEFDGTITDEKYWGMLVLSPDNERGDSCVSLSMPCNVYESLNDPKKLLTDIVERYNIQEDRERKEAWIQAQG